MNKEQIMSRLRANSHNIKEFHVKALYLFGSVARGEADHTSDVDLLVEFEDGAHIGLFEFSRLQRTLAAILECNVDLVTPDALHKTMKRQILEEAVRAA